MKKHFSWYTSLDPSEASHQPARVFADASRVYDVNTSDDHGIIYVIYNILNLKYYLGQTQFSNLIKRWIGHLRAAFMSGSSFAQQRKLYRAFELFGLKSFFIVPLEYLWYVNGHFDSALAVRRENYWMRRFDSVHAGYNHHYEGIPRSQSLRVTRTLTLRTDPRPGMKVLAQKVLSPLVLSPALKLYMDRHATLQALRPRIFHSHDADATILRTLIPVLWGG